jgi:hypothetical protein
VFKDGLIYWAGKRKGSRVAKYAGPRSNELTGTAWAYDGTRLARSGSEGAS